ncbi:DNA topoisomerase IB [Flavobacterium sp.]|uniref:DNA topoisomerase IB n=1 Tax=Flavobacterium sp. TaxID=239 RepID=UPI002603F02C|nr:DNA topoisomerase IB [Flavobacterium sp.]
MNRLQSKLEKIGRDPKITAKAVGLRYSGNFNQGYFRIRLGDGFKIVDESHKSVRNKEVLERIRKLVIPPAWEDVWISPYENGHLQVTGTDAKGRKQYRYHANWNKIRNQSKFFRLRNFAAALPKIRAQVDADLRLKGLPYKKVVALVVKLIEQTNIRIGNDAYKKLYGSFGLTTMQDKHVTFEKSDIYFEFVGKKGVKHKISLHSRKLLNLVKQCKEIPGQDLFQYYDDYGNHHVIGSADINNYLKNITNEDFTAKDFRLWSGSVNALCAFREIGEPKNESDCRHKIVDVIDSVAVKLGNTRAVCRKYYVHPTVIAAYEKGSIWKYKPAKSKLELTNEENILVNLLKNEAIAEVIA